MKKYERHLETCIKCGEGYPDIEYRSEAMEEYLSLVCRRCGYSWNCAPLNDDVTNHLGIPNGPVTLNDGVLVRVNKPCS